ncbi:recombinase family protein [Streptomyces ipomoeae]|uniref:Recombinase family protein n=1 Tax=Streptomyces ipomoeae TaxID=103232 RepID=A0AAE8VYR7_9ACTN|nr:recombinase family protein [Streptomyces ipomoeae]TQE26416.1 recombinase family protein [Streptomyces ipomoeae]
MTAYEYGYARVSTTAQDLKRQLDWLEAQGVPAERIYADKRTGSDFEREGLADVLSQLRSGDVLYVASLDRLGRTMHKVLALVAELREKGVHLVIGGAMTIDTRVGGPATDMALLMLGTFAEMELIFQRERRASARASRESSGKSWGRPREIDRSAVLADLNDGMSVMKVAAKHGIGRATVFRIKGEAKSN